MRWLCWFMQCDWWYFGNVAIPDHPNAFDSGPSYHLAGLYQCHRCKQLSLGSPTDPQHRAVGKSEP